MIELIRNTEDLLRFHEEITARSRDLMRRKNHDYSGVDDVFQNFRRHKELGILVRAGDKLQRLDNFERLGSLKVADESIQDTAVDLINYSVLYLAFKRDGLTQHIQQFFKEATIGKTIGRSEVSEGRSDGGRRPSGDSSEERGPGC